MGRCFLSGDAVIGRLSCNIVYGCWAWEWVFWYMCFKRKTHSLAVIILFRTRMVEEGILSLP